MLGTYHISITRDALGESLHSKNLARVIQANLGQDRGLGLLFHPEYHFDDNGFQAGERYVADERRLAVTAVVQGRDRKAAWAAFGRLLHARQDFYAHSNWIPRWAERAGGVDNCRREQVELCLDATTVAQLRSGRASPLVYVLYHLPGLGGWLGRRGAFADSHEAMHLDHPGRGPLFPFAITAATRHTVLEFEKLLAAVREAGGEAAVAFLLDQRSPSVT